MTQIKLSPSKVSEFFACPRCFFDAYALKIKKPRGIFPSLPGGMDRIIKKHFDNHRGDMPPEIKNQVEGVLLNSQDIIDRWRNWRTGMTYTDEENNIILIGAIDDCVVIDKGEPQPIYIPLDYKTKGKKPEDSGVQYYQIQLDCYNLMISSQRLKTKNEGYLVYFYPIEVNTTFVSDENSPIFTRGTNGKPSAIIQNEAGVVFGVTVFKVDCSGERAKAIVRKAAECLRSENRPEPSNLCENCQYIEQHIIKDREVR